MCVVDIYKSFYDIKSNNSERNIFFNIYKWKVMNDK